MPNSWILSCPKLSSFLGWWCSSFGYLRFGIVLSCFCWTGPYSRLWVTLEPLVSACLTGTVTKLCAWLFRVRAWTLHFRRTLSRFSWYESTRSWDSFALWRPLRRTTLSSLWEISVHLLLPSVTSLSIAVESCLTIFSSSMRSIFKL